MPNIFPAQPYVSGTTGSFGNALHMLLRQYNFPTEHYSEKDHIIMKDDDRCLQADMAHAERCYNKHTGTGEGRFGSWLRRATDEQVMEFLKDILQAPANIQWTGYRIKVSVHPGNGWDIHTLELFAKHPTSNTKVESANPCERGW